MENNSDCESVIEKYIITMADVQPVLDQEQGWKKPHGHTEVTDQVMKRIEQEMETGVPIKRIAEHLGLHRETINGLISNVCVRMWLFPTLRLV